YSF
ncbi:hypothetical protein D031_4196B, partial [Vibrio parahaemolyticus VP-48]